MNWSSNGESPALAANVRAKRIPQNKIVALRLLFDVSMKMFFPFDTIPNIIADSQRLTMRTNKAIPKKTLKNIISFKNKSFPVKLDGKTLINV